MPTEKYLDWARGQLNEADIDPHVKDSVLVLLTAFFAQEHSVEHRGQVLDLFDSLAHLHAINVRSTGAEVWVQARAGAIVTGDTVRVKKDAVPAQNPNAIYHNGRQGRIVAIRRGEVYVAYTDDREPKSPDTGIRFLPGMLEKRVK